jgi:hypothetical protein
MADASSQKSVVAEAFDTVGSLDAYLTVAFGFLNKLTWAVGNVTGVVDDLQSIANRDINITGFRTEIAVGLRAGRGPGSQGLGLAISATVPQPARAHLDGAAFGRASRSPAQHSTLLPTPFGRPPSLDRH